MPRDNEPAIEVEVLEIDGAAPPPPRDHASALAGIATNDDAESSPGSPSGNWQQNWSGQLSAPPAWWWPVFFVGGAILLAIALTLGVLVVALLLIYRIIKGLLRALFE